MLGIIVAGLAAFGLAMMHITQTIPYRLPSNWKREDDPRAFAGFRILFSAMMGAGLLVALAGFLTGS